MSAVVCHDAGEVVLIGHSLGAGQLVKHLGGGEGSNYEHVTWHIFHRAHWKCVTVGVPRSSLVPRLNCPAFTMS